MLSRVPAPTQYPFTFVLGTQSDAVQAQDESFASTLVLPEGSVTQGVLPREPVIVTVRLDADGVAATRYAAGCNTPTRTMTILQRKQHLAIHE